MSFTIEHVDDEVKTLIEQLKNSFSANDFEALKTLLNRAFQAGVDSVKAEADIINETVEQISGRREDEASNAMAQVMLLQFSRMTGKQTVSVTVDTDTIVDDLASTRLTKIAPSEHEITYTLDVLP